MERRAVCGGGARNHNRAHSPCHRAATAAANVYNATAATVGCAQGSSSGLRESPRATYDGAKRRAQGRAGGEGQC